MEASWSMMSRFGASDHYLIENGLLADCEVVCDGKTWKLHKLILCSRSRYFKDHLLNNPSVCIISLPAEDSSVNY
ncbi:hypothetical protein LY76DRAFT_415453 [Colletotrichum caudatum]|nr:hypothetical protein LY76DRAFT_415453 [Colletotrichum caudatum]